LRLSVYPELAFGKRFRFNFNFSPYVSIRIHSYKNGTSWYYYYGHETVIPETGSANDDITHLDVGFRQTFCFGYSISPSLVLSLEECGNVGIFPVNKQSTGNIKTAGICLFFCTSFIIPAKESRTGKKPDK
jgi:hypothetical protein